jgi:hypothetical protein
LKYEQKKKEEEKQEDPRNDGGDNFMPGGPSRDVLMIVLINMM